MYLGLNVEAEIQTVSINGCLVAQIKTGDLTALDWQDQDLLQELFFLKKTISPFYLNKFVSFLSRQSLPNGPEGRNPYHKQDA